LSIVTVTGAPTGTVAVRGLNFRLFATMVRCTGSTAGGGGGGGGGGAVVGAGAGGGGAVVGWPPIGAGSRGTGVAVGAITWAVAVAAGLVALGCAASVTVARAVLVAAGVDVVPESSGRSLSPPHAAATAATSIAVPIIRTIRRLVCILLPSVLGVFSAESNRCSNRDPQALDGASVGLHAEDAKEGLT
jgi:hypothetical protein